MKINILIVDDDPVQRRLLEAAIEKFGYQPVSAEGGQEALDLLDEQDFSLIILDLVMPDLDGMAVLERLRKAKSNLPVIVQTSQGGIDTVVSAMRAGAYDFAVKPVSPERLHVSIQNALTRNTLENELQRVKRSVSGELTFKDVITSSPRMQKVIDLGERAAHSTIPILLEGESGVGKEMIARAIQGTSNRRAKPFITVNCGAIPENLVESILFGHEKGAFTGATEKQIGKFQEADGGTLFLDEIGELPLDVQVKLLRAVQEGEVDPVGGRKPVKVDIRIISATNRSLIDMVKEGTFREDLYYRLNVFPITIPALRDHREDVPQLAFHFTARFAAEEGRRHIKGITKHALDMLGAFNWPGNIRQLENAVFRAVVLCDGTELTPAEFPQITSAMSEFGYSKTPMPTYSPTQNMWPEFSSDDPNIIGANEGQHVPSETELDEAMLLMDRTDNIRTLEELEADIIKTAYNHYNGQMSEIARRLGIGRSTLYRKMREYNIGENDENAA
ncbi:MAG: sigma-54 dependent transcriptional regulator [Hyphomicrobiales bacterium]